MGVLYVKDGGNWIPLASSPTPPGAVMMYGGPTAPAGWLICNGMAVSRSIYAALFAAIGTTYGAGDGSTTFALPDSFNKFPMATSPGATGGSANHQHPLSDLGAAKVSVANGASPAGFIWRTTGWPSWTANLAVSSAGTSSSQNQTVGAGLMGTTDNASTLPPYVGFWFIIKT